MREADLADVVALLIRTAAAALPPARSRRWARQWLVRGGPAVLRPALRALAGAVAPADDDDAVAAWQDRLATVRAEVVAATGGRWPSSLPGVGGGLTGGGRVLPPPTAPPPPLTDRRFAAHAASCPHGRPPDGRPRIDLFPDVGAFPAWWRGGASMASPRDVGMPPDLAADLWAWAQAHELREAPGEPSRASAVLVAREELRLQRLAARLEAVSGLAAVVRPVGALGGRCPVEGCETARPPH